MSYPTAGVLASSVTGGGPTPRYKPQALAETDDTNPKDRLGVKKVSLSKIPAVALVHCAHAMMNGADKYGAYNWREKKVIASIYVDAAMRHLLAWFEGEQVAGDSGVHHLGHAMACMSILLDAEARGRLVDDRPQGEPAVLPKVMNEISRIVQEKRQAMAPRGKMHYRRPHGYQDSDTCPDCCH